MYRRAASWNAPNRISRRIHARTAASIASSGSLLNSGSSRSSGIAPPPIVHAAVARAVTRPAARVRMVSRRGVRSGAAEREVVREPRHAPHRAARIEQRFSSSCRARPVVCTHRGGRCQILAVTFVTVLRIGGTSRCWGFSAIVRRLPCQSLGVSGALLAQAGSAAPDHRWANLAVDGDAGHRVAVPSPWPAFDGSPAERSHPGFRSFLGRIELSVLSHGAPPESTSVAASHPRRSGSRQLRVAECHRASRGCGPDR